MRVGILGGPKTCQAPIRLSNAEIHAREPAGDAQLPRSAPPSLAFGGTMMRTTLRPVDKTR